MTKKMVRKRDVIIHFRLNFKSRYILESIGFLDKIGRVQSTHGSLSEFINSLIIQPFEGKDILEVEFPRHQMIEKQKQIDQLRKEIANLGLSVQKIKDRRIDKFK